MAPIVSPSRCAPAAQDPTPLARPDSPRDLFWSFTWLALQGFGGVLAVIQREMVEKKRWLTNAQFLEEWAVAQIMPGPNVVNFAIMLGDRFFGWRGALASASGMLLFPLLLVMALTMVYAQFSDVAAVVGALKGMGAVAAGLVAGMGLKLASTLRHHPLGRIVSAALVLASFLAIVWLQWPLAWVLLTVGGAGCVLSWRKLAA